MLICRQVDKVRWAGRGGQGIPFADPQVPSKNLDTACQLDESSWESMGGTAASLAVFSTDMETTSIR